ncbi:unnamed protein product [Urochloa humidicola]
MPVRRRQPRRQETGAAERYREMGIAAALSRPWDYPTACGELASLLRLGYADLPKVAQALVAADVLLAFRLLPDVQTGYALSAANVLIQAVEVALPKQKKAQAVSEFKRSVVAHKRRARVQQNSEFASWKFASNRALCGHCTSVIWLSNLTCAAPHHCPKNGRDEVKLRPLLPDTVAKYILHGDDLAAASSSESDDTDDSDYENGHLRFWPF